MSHLPFSLRLCLTKLRIGVFPINIELGRYKKIPLEERRCPACPDDVETEIHFLLHCGLYKEKRETLFRIVEQKTNIDPQNLDDEAALFCLLNVAKIAKDVGTFAKDCIETRNSFLSSRG